MKTTLQKTMLIAMLAFFGLSNIAISQTITDVRDGQVYETVTIGTQIWMQENMNYELIGSSVYYNNDSTTYANTYGRLYTWFDATNNLCPTGFHLPSREEWTTLITYLGGTDIAGGKMKESGTTHWTPDNVSGDNSSGFTALPSGYNSYGSFSGINTGCKFWTSTQNNVINAYYIDLSATNAKASEIYSNKASNYVSVRCISDIAAGINEKSHIKNIPVFPNPTSGKFTLGSTKEINSVVVYNAIGEVVYQSGNPQAEIDLSEQPTGIYFLEVKAGEKIYNQKIVKE